MLLLFGFFLAVAATGADLGKTTILAGAFGVGVGFGLQDIVNNFVSGLILIVERPVLPGDIRRLHWALPDPAAEAGDPTTAFRRTRDVLAERLGALRGLITHEEG